MQEIIEYRCGNCKKVLATRIEDKKRIFTCVYCGFKRVVDYGSPESSSRAADEETPPVPEEIPENVQDASPAIEEENLPEEKPKSKRGRKPKAAVPDTEPVSAEPVDGLDSAHSDKNLIPAPANDDDFQMPSASVSEDIPPEEKPKGKRGRKPKAAAPDASSSTEPEDGAISGAPREATPDILENQISFPGMPEPSAAPMSDSGDTADGPVGDEPVVKRRRRGRKPAQEEQMSYFDILGAAETPAEPEPAPEPDASAPEDPPRRRRGRPRKEQ